MKPSTRVVFLLAISMGALACASKREPAGDATAEKQAQSGPKSWVSAFDRDHVLVGLVLDVRAGRWASPDEVTAAATASEWVFLGEQHDNVDHHLMQASILGAVVRSGKRPTLVAEMLDNVDQGALDAARAASPDDPDVVPRAVKWEESGWPPWSTYRPVFAEATRARLPIVGAGLDRAAARGLVKTGLSAFDPGVVERFGLGTPLPPIVHERLRDEMRDAHCGFLPEAMLDGMVLVQRARDALLAERALQSPTGAVVIAGAGHVRTDAGAPRALEHASGKPTLSSAAIESVATPTLSSAAIESVATPTLSSAAIESVATPTLSIAFLEVQRDKTRPEDYAAPFGVTSLPFDYVWFTPRASDADHCEELRKHHARDPGDAGPKATPGAVPPPSSAPPP